MHTNYILDASVLLSDPQALFQWPSHCVHLPLAVVRELDRCKQAMGQTGHHARAASRHLEQLRCAGQLLRGVPRPGGGRLQVHADAKEAGLSGDEQILALAVQMRQSEEPCVVVSQDVNLRLQADVLGVSAEDYVSRRDSVADLYRGYAEIEVADKCLMNFRHSKGFASPCEGLHPNQYLLLRSAHCGKTVSMGRVSADGATIRPLMPPPRDLRMAPRNKEQHFLMDALLDPAIHLVTAIGRAGSGKTLLASAVGYYLTVVARRFRKMLVARPTVPMGRDIGFLPGEVADKLERWMHPIYDALQLVADTVPGNGNGGHGHKPMDGRRLMEASGCIEIEALTYLRGRSLHSHFFLADETQSITPLEAKTILTRAGSGTKIVMTGDLYQIDNPHMDSISNGLAQVVEAFRDSSLAAHVTLDRCLRSDLAEEASVRLAG
jgi:PhoH-like ATPase